MTCYAVEFGYGPISWRCNRPRDHYPETPHASEQFGVVQHEWVDE
jgi:hypothetical protein